MRNRSAVWRTSVGLKSLVAFSGLLLWAWVVLHAFGLGAVFSGPAVVDGYAAMLHGRPALLWAMRAGLVALSALHFGGALLLARRARSARGVRGAAVRYRSGSLVSRSMRPGGVALFAFIVLHVLHMTTGALHPAFVPGHVYENLVRGLASPLVSASYLAAALVLGLHLLHGLWSAPRSLGLREGSARATRRPIVAVLALALVLGFAAVPVAVLAGVVR